ncbi:tail fiber domain-containing protein [bacterium MSK18_59]|nr:tail fiber domain-containing protein [bacterium MSK18_59]
MLLSSNELDMLILQHGKDGTSADSKYIWVKYAQDKNGTGLTDDPTNAVYIGIAYNKTEKHESDNPNDYTWTRIKGNDGESAYTVILQNENITFSVSNQNNIALMDQSFDTSVVVFKGTDAVSNFTIGTVESKNGISVIQKNNTITFSVEAGNKIEADYGKFSIPISVNGLVFKKEVSWSLAKAGAVGGQGNPGEPALSISLGNESQNIPCTYDGHVINDMLIEISFVGYRGLTRTPCNVAVGTLPSGMTLGSIENCTISNDGSIILNIVKNATLGTESTLTGNIVLTFSINGKTLVKNFTWTKSKDGGLSYIYSIEPSSYVINKTYDGTLSPASITFNAYYQKDGSDRIPYNGLFTIEESTTGSDFKSTYLSSKNESSLIYTPTSNNIKSVRCTLSQADKVSVVLDRQTVIVLSDDKMKDALTTVTTRVNGVSSKVDGIDKKITNKVWQTDITTAVNNYDGTTVKSLRDQVSSQETKIGEITSEVSDVKTTIENNQASVQKDIASMKQDATGFKQTVASTYETKNDASTKYSSFDQRAGKIETSVKTLQGNVTTLSQTDTEIKAELKTAKGDITTLKSDASGLSTKITNAQGDINTLKSDASSMKSDISDAKGNISTLQRTSSNLQSQITNNKTDINILTGDPMNYSKLNESTSDYWGFTYDGTADGRWYTMKTLSRDKFISGYYECMGGESFNIEFEISTSVKGNSTNGGTDSTYKGTAIGLYGFDAQKQSVGINYSTRTTATAAAPATKISSVVSVPANSRYFRVFLQTESWGNFSGTLKIRNVIVSRIKAIETRMSSAETSIRQNANDISLRATNVQLEQAKKDINGKFADYSTTSEMNSAIKVKADSITQEVSKTYTKQTDFNSLYIGGRNLALTTSNAYSSGYSNFSGIQNTCVFTANVLTDGLNVGDTITVRILYKYTNIVPTAGQTALVWLQGQGNVTGWHSGAFPGSSSIAISGSGEYEFLYTATINSDHLKNSYWDTMFRHDYVQSGTVRWKMFKVEKGNRHSEWSPAPEDTSAAITKVEQTATGIRADLSNTQGDVSSLQATASGLQKSISNAQGDINTMKSDATTMKTRISNAEGDITTLKSTASGLSTKITNTQGDINTLKSDAKTMKTRISNAEGDISTLQQTANGFQVQLSKKADQVDSFNAAKTATNFMEFTSGNGLQIGNKTDGSWSGYRTKISASAFEILNREGTTLAYYGDKLIQLGKNAKDAVIELCGGVGKILVETKSGNAALSIQSEYVDIKGVHESVLETSSSSGSCIAGAVDDSFVVNTYSDANNKANFDIGNGSIILESKKKGYQAEVEFYGCGWSGGVYTGAFAPTKAYSEKIMLGDSGRVWERLIVKNSPQVTSDRRAKTNIFPLGESKINKTDIHSELFDRLKPVQYRMIDGDGRICYGFVAQDVVEAMRELGIREDELDLVHHDRKNTEDGYIDTYSMVYTNLIAVITHELQLEKQRRSNLELEVADLRSELETMRDNLSGNTN